MKTYNIDANHVIRHYDVTGKYCPGIIGWNSASGDESEWLAFKSKLVEKPKPKNEEEEEVTQERFNEMMNTWMVEQAKLAPSDWSKQDREWAEANGLIAGDEKGNKMYKKLMTREEFVAVLHRAIDKFIK